jgi:hypothetical protein
MRKSLPVAATVHAARAEAALHTTRFALKSAARLYQMLELVGVLVAATKMVAAS